MLLGYKNSFVLCCHSLGHCSSLNIARSTLRMRWLDSPSNSDLEKCLLRRLSRIIDNFMTDSNRAKRKSMFNQIPSVFSMYVCAFMHTCNLVTQR